MRPTGALLSRRKPVFLDPHEDSYTISVVDANGVELARAVFPTSSVGYLAGVELVNAHGVHSSRSKAQPGRAPTLRLRSSLPGFDSREFPPQRTAAQRRARRLDKTDHDDAVAAARSLLAEPTLGPAQALEV